MMKLTLEELLAGQSEKGGYTKAQLEIWGVPYPPPKGWKGDLLAGRVPGEHIAAKRKTRRSSQSIALQPDPFKMVGDYETYAMFAAYLKRQGLAEQRIADHENLTNVFVSDGSDSVKVTIFPNGTLQVDPLRSDCPLRRTLIAFQDVVGKQRVELRKH